jgi:hypothetical protein
LDERWTRNSPLVPIFEDLTDGRVLKEWELFFENMARYSLHHWNCPWWSQAIKPWERVIWRVEPKLPACLKADVYELDDSGRVGRHKNSFSCEKIHRGELTLLRGWKSCVRKMKSRFHLMGTGALFSTTLRICIKKKHIRVAITAMSYQSLTTQCAW